MRHSAILLLGRLWKIKPAAPKYLTDAIAVKAEKSEPGTRVDESGDRYAEQSGRFFRLEDGL
jgi:hypothetical protein